MLNREPKISSSVAVVLEQLSLEEQNAYKLITAYIGSNAPPEPWDNRLKRDKEAKDRSLKFWDRHALVYDPEIIVPGTETETCPWA